MDLAQMAAIATDLGGRVTSLEQAVAELTAHPSLGDSVAVPNQFFINKTTGKTEKTVSLKNAGIAVVKAERVPAAGDYRKPGERAFELMLGSGVEHDTIGALPEILEIALPGLFHNIPVPVEALGPGNVVVDFTNPELVWVPTLQESQAGKLWTHFEAFKPFSPTGLLMYQLKGEAGGTPELKLITSCEKAHFNGVVFATYNSKGELIGTGSIRGEPGAKIALGEMPADGIMYLVVSHQSFEVEPESKEAYPGLDTFEFTLEKLNANPFEFPTFKLPEGFIYNITGQWTFLTKEAVSASGLMQVEIEAELEPPLLPVQFASGSDYGFTAGAAQTFEPGLAGFVSLLVPPHQSTEALGGTTVKKLPKAPGNETEYAWAKQEIIIQQLEF